MTRRHGFSLERQGASNSEAETFREYNAQMNIVITGGTGFLGSRLVRRLINGHCTVTLIKRKSTDFRRVADLLSRPTLRTLECEQVESFFSHRPNVHAVIHAATNYGRTAGEPRSVFEANTLFPLRLLEAARDAKVPIFLNVGTSLPRDLNVYALSKTHFAEWAQAICSGGDTRFIHAVVEQFFGPEDDGHKFITHLINACLQQKNEIALTSGEQYRDFMHVDDVVGAILLLLEKGLSMPPGPHRFEIGSGKAVPVKYVAETIKQLTGAQSYLNFGALPFRANEPMFSQADISAMSDLGWAPKIVLKDGLRMTIEESRGLG